MADKTFTATVERWVKETEGALDQTVSTATTYLLADIKVVPGKNRTGSYAPKGTVPKDLGALAGSLQSSLYGSTTMTKTGESNYALVAGAMKAGDTATFLWGGTDAPYAARIHYGFTGEDSLGRTYNQPGLFWVDTAAAKWQGYVDEAAREAKAEITG